MFEFKLKMAFAISSIVHGYRVFRKLKLVQNYLVHLSRQSQRSLRGVAGMNNTDLDNHSFCCFEVASTASLAALIVAEASVSNNGPSGSGNVWV